MKKFKKLIVMIPVIVILLSFPVSAAGTLYSIPISQPPVGDNYGYVEVLGGSGRVYVYLYTIVTSDDSSARLLVTGNSTSITFDVARTFSSDANFHLFVYLYRDDGTSKLLTSGTNGSVTDSFAQGISGVHLYGNTTFNNNGAYSSSPVWSVSYGSDTYSYNALMDILAVLRQQSNSDIVSAVEESTSEITSGYENDTDTTLEGSDDYQALESEAIGSTNGKAQSEASDVTDQANSGFLKYLSAFSAVGNMFSDFFQITVPDFGVLVMISLAIGILPLLVGMSVNEAKATDKFNARAARQARRLERHRR